MQHRSLSDHLSIDALAATSKWSKTSQGSPQRQIKQFSASRFMWPVEEQTLLEGYEHGEYDISQKRDSYKDFNDRGQAVAKEAWTARRQHREKKKELFRWVGKSRFEVIRTGGPGEANDLGQEVGESQVKDTDEPGEGNDLGQEVEESYVKGTDEPGEGNDLGQEVGESQVKGTGEPGEANDLGQEVGESQVKADVPVNKPASEQRQDIKKIESQKSTVDTRNESYFKGTFPQAFEDSTVGSIAVKILDTIVTYGQRNVPLKYETREQEFLEMPKYARPIYMKRKQLDNVLGYIGLANNEVTVEKDSSCDSIVLPDKTYVPRGPEQPKLDATKPELKLEAYESQESLGEDSMLQCNIKGVVESHRELTFCSPTVPLPRMLRASSRRNMRRYEHSFQRPSGGYFRQRPRSRGRTPSYKCERICYGRTKRIRSRCDVWSKSELDRSTTFNRKGRYYRKSLYRKRITLKNILSECEKSKEWRQLEKKYLEGQQKQTDVECLSKATNDSPESQILKCVYKPIYKCQDLVTNYYNETSKQNQLNLPRFNGCSQLVQSLPSCNDYKYRPDKSSHYRNWWNVREKTAMDEFRPKGQWDFTNNTIVGQSRDLSLNCRHELSTAKNDQSVIVPSNKTDQTMVDRIHSSRYSHVYPTSLHVSSVLNTISPLVNSKPQSLIAKTGMIYHNRNSWRDVSSNRCASQDSGRTFLIIPAACDVKSGSRSIFRLYNKHSFNDKYSILSNEQTYLPNTYRSESTNLHRNRLYSTNMFRCEERPKMYSVNTHSSNMLSRLRF